jgi:hypothetical protein
MAEAVSFFVDCRRHGLWLDEKQAGVSIFRPVRDPNELRDLYENDLAALFEMARQGDVEADLVLRQSILNDAKEGPLTGRKLDILGWFLFGRQPEPPATRGRQELTDRNFLIATAVKRITALGITPTRNRARKLNCVSACQIVAEALQKIDISLSESAVERIWDKNKQTVETTGFVPLK